MSCEPRGSRAIHEAAGGTARVSPPAGAPTRSRHPALPALGLVAAWLAALAAALLAAGARALPAYVGAAGLCVLLAAAWLDSPRRRARAAGFPVDWEAFDAARDAWSRSA